MKLILIAGALALFFSLFGTPALIKFLARRGYGQFIRDDGHLPTIQSVVRQLWVASSLSLQLFLLIFSRM